MKCIVFATSNVNKIKEVYEIISPFNINVLSLKDLNLEITSEETGLKFYDNAKIKALDIASKCDYPVLSDDSGLCIDALDNFPGVHSARFMSGEPYIKKNQKILEMMKDKTDRRASFICDMYFIDKHKNIEKSFEGVAKGEITQSIDLNPISGFGYDPIFFSYDLNKRFSQATMKEKDSVSHRGRALKQFLEFIKNEGI